LLPLAGLVGLTFGFFGLASGLFGLAHGLLGTQRLDPRSFGFHLDRHGFMPGPHRSKADGDPKSASKNQQQDEDQPQAKSHSFPAPERSLQSVNTVEEFFVHCGPLSSNHCFP
jgi:hypothetical protein